MSDTEAPRTPAAQSGSIRTILPLAVWDAVDSQLSPHQQLKSAAKTLPLQDLRKLQFSEIVAGWHLLGSGAIDGELAPTLIRWRLLPRLPATWVELGNVTVGDVLRLDGIGVGKVETLIAYAAEQILDRSDGTAAATPTTSPAATGDLLLALRGIAAWGFVEGYANLVDALADAATGRSDAPREALAVIDALDLEAFAGRTMVAARDPLRAADALLSSFNERTRAILERRILAIDPARRATLEELGTDFSVTRERVRQLEVVIETKLRASLGSEAYRPLERLVIEVREQLGTACPIDAAPSVVRPDDATLVDELIAWCAGPYVADEDWLVRQGPTVQELGDRAFDRVAVNGIAPRVAVEEELMVSGIHTEYIGRLIDGLANLGTHEDLLYQRPRTIAGRAELALRLTGHPMTYDELFRLDDSVENRNSFRNALNDADAIVRIGVDRVGLADWNHEEYPGIVPAMVAAITAAGHSVDVGELAIELSEKFGISENSVKIHATMHPLFVIDGRNVRLRTYNEPYEPKTDLMLSRDCFVIDGRWALRIPVDQDVLRGSGRSIPEAFAVEIGLQPFGTVDIDGPVRHVHGSWKQAPTIGSIRLNVLELDLEEGDFVFVRHTVDNRFGFAGLRRSMIDGADPLRRIRLLSGGDQGLDQRGWRETLSSALGFSMTSTPTKDEIVLALNGRGQTDVLKLIDVVEGLHNGEDGPASNSGA